MRYEVKREWEGETCVILAGGPSLRTQDLTVAWNHPSLPRVITINDSWRLNIYAHVNYFCDLRWWQFQLAKNLRSFDGIRSFHDQIYKGFWVCGGTGFEDHPQVRQLRFTGQLGLENDPTGLRHGSNSGYAAINLAYLYGAKKIILLGYDMHFEKPERTHWHENGLEEPATLAKALENCIPLFNYLVEPLAAAGVTVLNATPNSALKCFPTCTLEEALNETTAKGV